MFPRPLAVSALALLAGCATGGTLIEPSPTPDAEVTLPVPEPASFCQPDMYEQPAAELANIAHDNDGSLLVVSTTSDRQLSRFHPAERSLEPLIDSEFSWVDGNYIDIQADFIRVFEWYPSTGYLTYDRDSESWSFDQGEPEAVQNSPAYGATHIYDGATYQLFVGGEECGNGCVLREEEDGESRVVFNANDSSLSLHTGSESFADDTMFVVTFENGVRSLHRMDLDTGELTLVQGLGSSGFVSQYVQDGDYVYWSRQTMQQGVSRLDRFHLDSQALEELPVALGVNTHELNVEDGIAIWANNEGIHRWEADASPQEERTMVLDQSDTQFHLSVAGDEVWYTYTRQVEPFVSTIGCATL